MKGKKSETKRRVKKKRIMAVIQEWRDESLNAAAAHHAHCRVFTVATETSRTRTHETHKSSLQQASRYEYDCVWRACNR